MAPKSTRVLFLFIDKTTLRLNLTLQPKMGDERVFENAPDVVQPLTDKQWNDNPAQQVADCSAASKLCGRSWTHVTNLLCRRGLAVSGEPIKGGIKVGLSMQNKPSWRRERRGIIRLFERKKEIKKGNKRAVAERAVWSWPGLSILPCHRKGLAVVCRVINFSSDSLLAFFTHIPKTRPPGPGPRFYPTLNRIKTWPWPWPAGRARTISQRTP
jgi:hypothetical protein